MLVLTRKLGQEIQIGDDIRITVVRIEGGAIRIGVDAPRAMSVVRGELAASAAAAPGSVPEPLASHQEFCFCAPAADV